MTVLVVAEHDAGALQSTTLSAITAAGRLGGPIHLLLAGADVRAAAGQAAAIKGVDKVLTAEAPHYADGLAEPLSLLIARLAGDCYSHVLGAATSGGRNVLPRVAALLDTAPLSDVVAVVDADTVRRPIFAGNALATVRSADPIKVMTIRATAFEAAPAKTGQSEIEAVAPADDPALSRLLVRDVSTSERPDLSLAPVVVAGGRGLQSAANFALLETLADRLGGAVGASRAAVDAGFAANDLQIGQTGRIVAPELYIAIGISGAIQHLAGMKDSKIIVAINKDPEAPIFKVADYGLVADLFNAVPDLTGRLSAP